MCGRQHFDKGHSFTAWRIYMEHVRLKAWLSSEYSLAVDKALVIGDSEMLAAAWHRLKLNSDHIMAPVIYQFVTKCHRCHKSDEFLALISACLVSVRGWHSCNVWVFSCSCNCKRNEALTGGPECGKVVRYRQHCLKIFLYSLKYVRWWVVTVECSVLLIPCCVSRVESPMRNELGICADYIVIFIVVCVFPDRILLKCALDK
jgi:hypothetical protein